MLGQRKWSHAIQKSSQLSLKGVENPLLPTARGLADNPHVTNMLGTIIWMSFLISRSSRAPIDVFSSDHLPLASLSLFSFLTQFSRQLAITTNSQHTIQADFFRLLKRLVTMCAESLMLRCGRLLAVVCYVSGGWKAIGIIEQRLYGTKRGSWCDEGYPSHLFRGRSSEVLPSVEIDF